ncbi:alpha-mannosidase [Alteribacter lacisalsi]|uniref:Alpha-mannosidase n=1 Tax=Alteribacter lacisalsi TaxID=2045244 RepID=A0A2W0HGY7_9BACI|nr:glycoside hydrolase family 38 C-terminal domain-containing protein [Alteribacter lacisalsi]PYZ96172.1 alpha-mannosidase [Alteribacter lacisalsi]
MTRQQTVFVVPHSHWDREWYFTVEDSNVLLIENMDHLLNVLDEDPDYHAYMFDGQASVIDEYIAKRPEEKERVARLVKDKRLFIGPWYTQADTLLVHKESIIRNLLYGSRIAESYGHNMNIGYLPDIFGQNAYLPSFFRGFGLDYSILQRGVYTDQLKGSMNFHWTSPDGLSVKTNNMYYGYGPGKFLSDDASFFHDRLVPILEKLADLNGGTDNILLPSGGDQVLVREHFPETVRKLNEKDPDRRYVLSDYETFMEKTWADGTFDNEIKGELLASQKSRIHNTIRSQRYDIKQLNTLVENKILNVLEPLCVIGESLGLRYPQAWLDEMWKELFDVHAHDSIGGCNSDDTNSDIVHRLEKTGRIADGLINLKKKQISEAVSRGLGKENIATVYNFLPKPSESPVRLAIFTKEETFSLSAADGTALTAEVTKQTYISGGTKIVVTAEGEKQVEEPGYYRSEVLVSGLHVPAMGYTTVIVNESLSAPSSDDNHHGSTIENGTLQLSFKNGSISLLHKDTKAEIENLLSFENCADDGDSYDFSPLEGDSPYMIERASLIGTSGGDLEQSMTIKHEQYVPASLEERKNGMETALLSIHTMFTLRHGESFVRVSHTIDNRICDHRVRAVIATDAEGVSHSFADHAFSLIERPIENPYLDGWKENGFAEAPVPIYPLENTAGVKDAGRTAAVITKGLKEYQVLPESGAIALTLFRSVGLLGKDNLTWRPGRASGINNKVVRTPDAQMQKTMTFDYAIVLEKPDCSPESVFDLKNQYLERYDSYQKQSLNTFEERLERFEIPYPVQTLPSDYSLFALNGDGVQMSMCKRSHDQDGTVIRLFNPSGSEKTATFEGTFSRITFCSLNEKEEKPADPEQIPVPARGYVTLKLQQ